MITIFYSLPLAFSGKQTSDLKLLMEEAMLHFLVGAKTNKSMCHTNHIFRCTVEKEGGHKQLIVCQASVSWNCSNHLIKDFCLIQRCGWGRSIDRRGATEGIVVGAVTRGAELIATVMSILLSITSAMWLSVKLRALKIITGFSSLALLHVTDFLETGWIPETDLTSRLRCRPSLKGSI